MFMDTNANKANVSQAEKMRLKTDAETKKYESGMSTDAAAAAHKNAEEKK